jgi:predicted amidohydrolase YtcJ
VWTVEAAPREARAVAVAGDRIVKVGPEAEVLALRGPRTEVVDLRGRLLLPGFIDAHTHFENAADWIFHVGLYDVKDAAQLAARLAEAVRRVPDGLWISGGDFGAYAAWDAAAPVVPDLKAIDAVTPRHPVLVRRVDGAWFANSEAFRFTSPEQMERDIVGADASGFDPVVHTIGDKAHRLLLDWYETAIRANPPRERRFRVIHAWYPSARDIERIGRLKLIVDVTPNHLLRGLGSLERSLGPERSRTAHAWRSMMRAGARLDLVSDWPGSFNEQEMAPLSPLENISYAISRSNAAGQPPGGWHPEERLTVDEAIEAYTANPAFASWEEDRKGTIREGKLADLVILSHDILSLSAADIRATRVDYTVLGGRIIYRRPQ